MFQIKSQQDLERLYIPMPLVIPMKAISVHGFNLLVYILPSVVIEEIHITEEPAGVVTQVQN